MRDSRTGRIIMREREEMIQQVLSYLVEEGDRPYTRVGWTAELSTNQWKEISSLLKKKGMIKEKKGNDGRQTRTITITYDGRKLLEKLTILNGYVFNNVNRQGTSK